MPSLNSIAPDKLYRLVGTGRGSVIIDVRTPEAFAADPRLLPASLRRAHDDIPAWAAELGGRSAVIVSNEPSFAEGAAAWLRHEGVGAETLEGGIAAWALAGLPLISEAKLPARDSRGRTAWVTRARPKVDRIACPWLVRRFIDPAAIFLFVPPVEVQAVAAEFSAAPFDVDAEGVVWSHRGDLCTFDVMLAELGLDAIAPLSRLASIVRGADTGRPELAPQAAGLLAASLGLSRMYPDDLEQLDAGMIFYDALYRWCRDAVEETHGWESHRPRRKAD